MEMETIYNKVWTTYDDFEAYFKALEGHHGIVSVVVGTIEDVASLQKSADSILYPMLFVHIPDFPMDAGRGTDFSSDLVVLVEKTAASPRQTAYEITQLVNAQLFHDARNGLFSFNGKFQVEPKGAHVFSNTVGWLAAFTAGIE